MCVCCGVGMGGGRRGDTYRKDSTVIFNIYIMAVFENNGERGQGGRGVPLAPTLLF